MNKRIFLIIVILFQIGKVSVANYPPRVKIQNPTSGSKFKLDEEIVFRGIAVDLEDGELPEKNLTWTSDLDIYIGQGNSLTYKGLSVGPHIVMLTAFDSEGSVGRDSVFITIQDPKITKPIVKKPKKEPKTGPEGPKLEELEPGAPSIEFLFVPSFRSFEDLTGRVLSADPNNFAVAVYIMKDGLWWSKRVGKINREGRWICDITTAERDEVALKILVYLVPSDFKPPLASGNFQLSHELEKNSVAKIEVLRKIRMPKVTLQSKREPEIKKIRKKPEPKGPIEALGELLIRLLPKEKQTTETLKRYLPLAVGNKWTYQRTVYKSDEVFHYRKQIIEKPGWNSPPRGAVYFTLGRTIEKMPQSSLETYSISNSTLTDKFASWDVEIEGTIPRDGRYSSLYIKEEPNVKWLYVDGGVWELMQGEYLGAETISQTWLAVLEPGIIISDSAKEGEIPFWAIGAVLIPEKITTPAGKFSSCLKNCTMIRGQNLKEVLLKDMPPEYSEQEDGFGNFTTISFYAEDVGLIKEVQYNSKGELVYELALIEYKVN